MLPVRGLLHNVVCPAFRDGECEKQRVGGCLFSHDANLLEKRPHPDNATGAVKRAGPTPTTEGVPRKQARREATSESNLLTEAPALPRITSQRHPPTSKISLAQRQDGLKKVHTTLCRFYAPIWQHSDPRLQKLGREMAASDALRMEEDVFQHVNEYTYKTSSIAAAASVNKRATDVLASAVHEAAIALAGSETQGAKTSDSIGRAKSVLDACTETGSEADVQQKRQTQERQKKGRLTRERIIKAGFLCPKGDLEKLGYVTEIPPTWGAGSEKPDACGERPTCARCGIVYRVGPLGRVNTDNVNEQDPEACHFHSGRPRPEKLGMARARKVYRWSCCGRTVDSHTLGDDRCATGPHVFKEEGAEALHKRSAYVTWSDIPGHANAQEVLPVAALDCEMSYTTAGISVTRITLVDETGDVVFDELIRCPDGVSMIDLNTQFSGIHAEAYEAEAIFDLDTARRALAQYIGPQTILIGHGLENDLHAIRLVHTNVVDTCQLFPHPRGLPYRLALRDLVAKYLGRIIQAGGASVGHSSAEDAQMTLELVRWKWLDMCS